jgi:hypothetical protein
VQNSDKIDYAKLLGFEVVAEQIAGSVDFQDETVGAKLGAKVGLPETGASAKLTEAAATTAK